MAPQDRPPAAAQRTRHGAGRSNCRLQRTREGSPPRCAAFEAYYLGQQIVPESEWSEFIGVLRLPIPVVVRLNRTKSRWQELQESFAADPRWRSLPWFPSAWQCAAVDYNDALRTQCGALNKAYALRFQEAASLVPPLLLNVGPNDLLLDLCAAPGSKTLESLELMREKSCADEGVVIANDADAERCFELLPLITRKARHPGTAVVLGSAAKFPAQFQADGQQVLFDRIVCDVPCSGDGTLRRRPHCWSSWTVDYAMKLHSKQLQILCRGLHLLRPGGRLVYSTCSLNPLENEAVVCAALSRFKGDFSPVRDAAAELVAQGLNISPGLSSWRVPHPTDAGVWFASWEEVPLELRKPSGLLAQSMFVSDESTDFASTCIRLNPHRIDGSGFFVAVIEKSAHRGFPVQVPQSLPDAIARLPWRARNENNRYEVVAPDAPDVRSIADFYGIQEVPSPLLAEYNIKGRLTQLNLVNASVLQFLQHHLNCKGSPLLVSVGVPLFKLLDENFMTNIDVPSRWRPALEGAALLAPHMAKRLLRLDPESMQALLAHRSLPMQRVQQLAAAGTLFGLETCDNLLGGAVVGLHDGSFWAPCIITGLGIELYASSEELGDPAPVLLPLVRPAVVCEGDGYVALAKPAGMRTEDALRLVADGQPAAELVSRLDKQTSGCLLIPTTSESAAVLTRQFAESSVQKTYLALVWGSPPEAGKVDAPLALTQSGGGSRYRAYVDESGKPSLTRYQTVWRYGEVALVVAFPETGRTHQIRCHMAHVGFPLVGDTKYGGRNAVWCSRLPLHCLRVQAIDVKGHPIDAMVAPPDDFVAAVDLLRGDDGPDVNWQSLFDSVAPDLQETDLSDGKSALESRPDETMSHSSG